MLTARALSFVFEGLANKQIADGLQFPRPQSKPLCNNSSLKPALEPGASWSAWR
jgi:hypothetical protein